MCFLGLQGLVTSRSPRVRFCICFFTSYVAAGGACRFPVVLGFGGGCGGGGGWEGAVSNAALASGLCSYVLNVFEKPTTERAFCVP